MAANLQQNYAEELHNASRAYTRATYTPDDSSSDDSDPEEALNFPEDQQRSLTNTALEIARIERKIERLEQYGVPVRANDQAFLTLEESLSVSRWILQEQIETKTFMYSLTFMVLLPLFICFPMFLTTSAEYWVSFRRIQHDWTKSPVCSN